MRANWSREGMLRCSCVLLFVVKCSLPELCLPDKWGTAKFVWMKKKDKRKYMRLQVECGRRQALVDRLLVWCASWAHRSDWVMIQHAITCTCCFIFMCNTCTKNSRNSDKCRHAVKRHVRRSVFAHALFFSLLTENLVDCFFSKMH